MNDIVRAPVDASLSAEAEQVRATLLKRREEIAVRIARAELDAAELRGALESRREQAEQLREETANARQEILFLRGQVSDQTALSKAAEERALQLGQRLERTEAALLDRSGEVQRLLGDLAEAIEDGRRLAGELASSNETGRRLESQLAETRLQVEGMAATVQDAQLNVRRLDHGMARLRAEFEERGRLMAQLKQSLSSAKERVASARADKERMRAELNRVNEQLRLARAKPLRLAWDRLRSQLRRRGERQPTP